MTPSEHIFKLVRRECKLHGVRFCRSKSKPDVGGYFDPESKVLFISTITRRRPPGKRTKKVPEVTQALVALHEMVHMWQWARGDKDFLDEEELYADLMTYSEGETWISKERLQTALPRASRLELEAEATSIAIARSMGLEIPSRWEKACKSYLYAWHVLVETGMWPSWRVRKSWYPHMTSDMRWDLTRKLLKVLCRITTENEHLCTTVWRGEECIRKPETT